MPAAKYPRNDLQNYVCYRKMQGLAMAKCYVGDTIRKTHAVIHFCTLAVGITPIILRRKRLVNVHVENSEEMVSPNYFGIICAGLRIIFRICSRHLNLQVCHYCVIHLKLNFVKFNFKSLLEFYAKKLNKADSFLAKSTTLFWCFSCNSHNENEVFFSDGI